MDKLIRIEQNIALLSPEISSKLAEFERQAEEIKAKQKELKDRILAEMEEHGILKIETDELSINYVAPYSKESFDSKAFRKDNPDLYDQYVKISTVSASVRMKVKE
jgi:regulator of replication initiation timing